MNWFLHDNGFRHERVQVVHCCIVYLPYYKTTIKIRFFLIFSKSFYKVKSQSIPSPRSYLLFTKKCENTACSKKAAFFKYLCIRQNLWLMNVLVDTFRAKYYAFHRNSDYATKKETKI